MLFGTSKYYGGFLRLVTGLAFWLDILIPPLLPKRSVFVILIRAPVPEEQGVKVIFFCQKLKKSNFSISSMFFIQFGSFLCLTWGIWECQTQWRTLEDSLTLFSILFVVPSKKPYEWAEGMKEWAEGPLTCAVALGIPKNPMLDPKIIKIWFREQKLWPF